MAPEDKPPVSQTQFGDLEERHSTFEESVNRRFDSQDRKLLELETMGRRQGKQIEAQSHDLLANTQATKRTEAKMDRVVETTKDFVEVADYAKKTFTLVEWVVKRLAPLVLAGAALIGTVGWFGKG